MKTIAVLLFFLSFGPASIAQELLPLISAKQAAVLAGKVGSGARSVDRVQELIHLINYHLRANTQKPTRNLDSAKGYLQVALKLQHGPKQSIVLKILTGEWLYQTGRVDSGQHAFMTAVSMAKRSAAHNEEGIAWYYAGASMYRYKESAYCLRQSMKSFIKAGNGRLYGIAKDRMGFLYHIPYYRHYRVSKRKSDTAQVPLLRRRLLTSVPVEEKIQICYTLCNIYTYKRVPQKDFADSVLFYARQAEKLASFGKKGESEVEWLFWKGIGHIQGQQTEKLELLQARLPDSLRHALWLYRAERLHAISPGANNFAQQLDTSLTYYKRSISLACRKKDFFMLKAAADGMSRVADDQMDRGNHDSALQIYDYLLTVDRKYRYTGIINLQSRRYGIFIAKGQLTAAMDCMLQIRDMVTEKSIPQLRYLAYYCQSDLYYWLGNYTESARIVEKMLADLALYREGYAYLYEAAELYFENMKYLGKVERVVPMLEGLKEKYPPIMLRDRYWFHLILAKSNMHLGRYEQARSNYLATIATAKSLGWSYGHLSAYLSANHFFQGRFEEADRLLGQEIASPAPNESYRVSLYYWKSRIDSALGRYGSSLDFLSRSQQLGDALLLKQADRLTRDLEYLRESRSKMNELWAKEREILLLQRRNELSRQEVRVAGNLIKQQLLQEAKNRTDLSLRRRSIEILKERAREEEAKLSAAKQVRRAVTALFALCCLMILLIFFHHRSKRRKSDEIARKTAEMERLVVEKEWLLKEMHHRVKNNLQMVVSLLEAQSAGLTDRALDALTSSQHKI